MLTDVVAWIAVALSTESKWMRLRDLVAWADYWNHAILTFDEVSHGLPRLAAAGLVELRDADEGLMAAHASTLLAVRTFAVSPTESARWASLSRPSRLRAPEAPSLARHSRRQRPAAPGMEERGVMNVAHGYTGGAGPRARLRAWPAGRDDARCVGRGSRSEAVEARARTPAAGLRQLARPVEGRL